MSGPVNSAQVWTAAGQAREIRQLLKAQTPALPTPDLLCLSRGEAASVLGVPALSTREAVELAAGVLRDRVCQAVLITDGDADYAHTLQASGWLHNVGRSAAGDAAVFTAGAADAIASGFVAMEAIVLACMASSDCQRHGGSQPRPDFALQIANLPHFSLPQATAVSGFAALSDPELGLYAVVDSAEWVARVVAAGVRTVQLRIKDAEGEQHRAMVRGEIRQSILSATAAGAQLFINDHWKIAIEEGAYGVHLGQEDLHIADLAAIRQAGLRLGISTHAYWEVCRAWALQPSYIACGPIHPTKAKAMPWIPQGNDNLAYWCKLLPVPVVGIAGMDVARTEEAAACGAAGVALISAITAAPSPEAAVHDLQQALQRGRSGPATEAPLLPRRTLAASSTGVP